MIPLSPLRVTFDRRKASMAPFLLSHSVFVMRLGLGGMLSVQESRFSVESVHRRMPTFFCISKIRNIRFVGSQDGHPMLDAYNSED